MAMAFAAFLAWFAVWRPVAAAHDAAERRHARAVQDRAVVVRTVARIRQVGGARAGGRTVPAGEAVNAAASAAGVTLAALEPDPEGGVQVRLNGIAPSRLFPWLATLQRDYGVAPRHLTIVKDGEGTLSVDATFGSAGRP